MMDGLIPAAAVTLFIVVSLVVGASIRLSARADHAALDEHEHHTHRSWHSEPEPPVGRDEPELAQDGRSWFSPEEIARLRQRAAEDAARIKRKEAP